MGREETARPVKIGWYRLADLGPRADAAARAAPDKLAEAIAKAEANPHPCFQLSDNCFLEIPPAKWKHGDLLVYLVEEGWLVRRNYVDHWYVDIGVLRPVKEGVHAWTDLWIDVTMGKSGENCRILDVGEFNVALTAGAVSIELGVYALNRLGRLLKLVKGGSFPPPEIAEAERAARGLAAP